MNFFPGLQNQNGRQREHLGEANIEDQRLRQEHHRGELCLQRHPQGTSSA